MKNPIINLIAAALVALAGAGTVAKAQGAPNVVLEGAVETTTDAVIFPSESGGRLTVRNCVGCDGPTLQLGPDTQYILAGQQLSLAEMAKYCRGAAGRALTITWRLKDRIVSRVAVLEK